MTVVSRGDVEIVSSGESRPLSRGEFISQGDQILVQNRSFAVIQLADGSKLALRPGSLLIIEQFQFGGGSGFARFSLLSGGLRVNQGAISSNQSSDFLIVTPAGTLALNEPEGSLTLCDAEICDQQGLVPIQE